MSLFSRVFISSIVLSGLLLSTSHRASAIELGEDVIPANLKSTYNQRQLSPLTCIKETKKFMGKIEDLTNKEANQSKTDQITDVLDLEQSTHSTEKIKLSNNAPTQVLASCYIELEEYPTSLSLLQPLLKDPSVTLDEMRTLNLIASNIPESARSTLNNEKLISMLENSLRVIETKNSVDSFYLTNSLNLSLAKLALETHQYELANTALSNARVHMKGKNDPKLRAWLAYYYAHYYDQINQHQLAISHFRMANNAADTYHYTKLSSLVKESLANLYQQKHRYVQAIHFASQRVELLTGIENYVQEADSLIKYSILKRQNKEFNQSLIYLLNALELVERKNKVLTAKIYLELGRTYASFPFNLKNNANFAQKYLQNARRQFQELNNIKEEAESILLLAQLNIRNKDTGLAIIQLEDIQRLIKDQFPDLRVKAFEMLALSYELSGDHQQANFYFKNFHSLQNDIKEKLFKLQQLKIDEQFQLIEQTQQKIQLEIENNQLLLKNNLFQKVAYWAIGFSLIMILLIAFLTLRHKRLVKKELMTRKKTSFHPRSHLPLHHAQIEKNKLNYKGEPLFYALVEVPFLNNLNEFKGLFKAEKIEHQLGLQLKRTFTPKTLVAQVRDNQFVFISEQAHYNDAENFALQIAEFFAEFAKDNDVNGLVSSGIVAFPFLNNVSRAIAPERMLNLTSLALLGARQIREKVNESSWLELYAIEKIQPAFFDGDLWLLGQAGIDSGIVKLKCSHPETPIVWPELNQRNT